MISEEYKCQKSQRSHHSNGKSSRNDDHNEAMTVSSTSRGGKARGRNHKFAHGTCWGCGGKGHFRDKCPTNPSKQKDRKGLKDSQKSGVANTVVGIDSDSEGKGAFAAVAIDDYDSDGSLPGLEAVSDSDSESQGGNAPETNWFFEAVNERGSDCGISKGSDWDPDDLFEDSVPAVDAPFVQEDPGNLKLAAAFISADNNTVNIPHTKVYNSGCTSHISPYHEDFENFVEIPPKPFQAANKQDFQAIGKGEMVIDMPNGTDISQLCLMEVLYSPEVGYTLVSVG